MSEPLVYPLQQLMGIKQNRFDQAVKVLEQKKEILEKAKKKLVEVTAERDEVLQHKTVKLEQFRREIDAGTTSDKIQQSKYYLKTVDERLIEKERAVTAQQAQVDQAQKQVDLATQEVFQRKKDLEKLQIHKQEWEKQARYWTEQKEAVEHDEQGSAAHQVRKQEAKQRKKEP
jgi:hypothetical protein